jgi:hypothetical protein
MKRPYAIDCTSRFQKLIGGSGEELTYFRQAIPAAATVQVTSAIIQLSIACTRYPQRVEAEDQ